MGLLHTQQGLCPNTHLPSPRSPVPGSRMSSGTGLEHEVTRGYAAGGRKAAVAPLATVICEPPGRAGTPEARPSGATPSGGKGSQTTPTARPGSARSRGRRSFPRSFFLTDPHHVSLQTSETGSAGPGHPQSLPAEGPHSPGGCSFQNMWHSPLCSLTLSAQPTFVSVESPTDLDLNSNPYQLPFIPRPLEHRSPTSSTPLRDCDHTCTCTAEDRNLQPQTQCCLCKANGILMEIRPK